MSISNLADRALYWHKIVSAFVTLAIFVLAAWTQYLGPGVKVASQDFLGVTELRSEVQEINRIMTPPRVVNWERVEQQGECDRQNCFFFVAFSRTPYGADCGLPSVVAEFRLSSGQIVDLEFRDFTPVEGTIRGTSVEVDLEIPRRARSGKHHWRVINTYPSCSWSQEPIPRVGPWWDVQVALN